VGYVSDVVAEKIQFLSLFSLTHKINNLACSIRRVTYRLKSTEIVNEKSVLE
jgi:hypothetical protein